MNKFTKWLIVSMSLALIGLVVVLNVEDWARLSGEMNRDILLFGTLSTFVLVLASLFILFKANIERVKAKIVMSLFTSVATLPTFVMNGLIFTVYFIGK